VSARSDSGPDLILAGRITGCHGIRGYLKIELTGDSRQRAEHFHEVFVGVKPENAVMHTVEDVRIDDRRVLVKLATVDDRTLAETLRGRLLFVRASEAAPPPEGGYYIHDLIGSEVRTAEGEIVGRLEDVVETPAQHLWVVAAGDRRHHIPAVKEFIVSVNVAQKEIVVDLPEGLLEE